MAGRRWHPTEIERVKRIGSKSFAELAREIGRTERAVRTMHERLQYGRPRWTVAALARHMGFDRAVVERVGTLLGLGWRSNGRIGFGARRFLTQAEADRVLTHLDAESARWSRRFAACRGCGTTAREGLSRHHGRGLCRRCERRSRKRGFAAMRNGSGTGDGNGERPRSTTTNEPTRIER